jgi:peptide/nickel transport system substrate-binding protein
VKKPYPVLLAQLVKLSIVPKAYVERVGDQEFNLKPLGSGPYKLRGWQKGVQVILDANESYWRGKPPFKTVIFRAVPDVSTRVADLRTGRADLIRLLPPDEAIALKSDARLAVLTVPLGNGLTVTTFGQITALGCGALPASMSVFWLCKL